MTERSTGRTAGYFSFGEVVNRKDDPTQTGKCKVRWNMGAVNQSDMSEDDLQWSHSLHPNGNPSRNHTGGPHTGFQEGTTVIGFSPSGDGQNMIMLGSTVSAGNGSPDSAPSFSSDLPYPALSQQNGQGGQSQPNSGDINGIVTQQSIVPWSEQQGASNTNALFAPLPDSIGQQQDALTS